MSDSATDGPDVIPLDVSELEPPEPMEQIFSRLHQLQDGQFLRVRHRREPFPIYPLLTEGGFGHHCIQIDDEVFLIYIWPASAPIDESFCRNDAAAEER